MATKFNNTAKAKERRTRAIARLEAQLKKGTKPTFGANASIPDSINPLSKEDITRINKELSILKTRI